MNGLEKNKIQREQIGFIGLLFISINISSDFVLESINDHKQKYEKVAMEIWNYAELGYQENKSADLLAQSLEDEDFQLKRIWLVYLLPSLLNLKMVVQ